jgi:hypothetical protein
MRHALSLAALQVAIVQGFQCSLQSSLSVVQQRPVSLKRTRAWVVPRATADGDAAASDAIPGIPIACNLFELIRKYVHEKTCHYCTLRHCALH